MGIWDILKAAVKGEQVEPTRTAQWIYSCHGVVERDGKLFVRVKTQKGMMDDKLTEYHDEDQIVHDLEWRDLTEESKRAYESALNELRLEKKTRSPGDPTLA